MSLAQDDLSRSDEDLGVPQILSPTSIMSPTLKPREVINTHVKYVDDFSPTMIPPPSLSPEPVAAPKIDMEVKPATVYLPDVELMTPSTPPVVDVSNLRWDGSYLGEYKRDVIDIKTETKRGKYWNLTINDVKISCQIRTIKSFVPCIVDELKPLFKLSKLGTHSIKIGKTKYLMIKVFHGEQGILEDYRLNEFEPDKLNKGIISQVQAIYVFRLILGLTQNYDRSIHIRKVGDVMYPLSFSATSMNPMNCPFPSSSVNKKWFTKYDTDFSKVLQKMLNIRTADDLVARLSEMRSTIERIIRRIDPDIIHESRFIVQHIQEKLADVELI